ncbi:hypothetical protein M0E87_02725 [Corynebacterium sp. CCM 9185]|uniref:Uncharacterized protein n=1 Tax=Corynebacterium marambiense TaxID=2765364 RepID=A0ABS0VSI9_9CORY|nr:hypothetical protein [Corynebacterium marambiense]MBI8999740.1 hypothetical protein [Corynebacterium marambiense]MCK7662580.1 hypothetical protein [Corynebacterium marambiense]MCX7543587.1 hypothetical protein [Corynebacterium marambiense]
MAKDTPPNDGTPGGKKESPESRWNATIDLLTGLVKLAAALGELFTQGT